MVVDKKSLIISALAVIMIISAPVSFAATSDLLKMDIKKSEAENTVNVVFYTTGDKINTVVSRKSADRYVVLLPNVSGNSSVVPNLGGVKEYIANVDVKNVNDGIGGYTKVTFTTTKPVNILTSTRKTLPLTKAQLEYKDLIAKNNTKPAVQVKPVAQTKPAVQAKPAEASKQNTQTKPLAQSKPSVQAKPAEQLVKAVVAKQPVQKTIQKAVSTDVNNKAAATAETQKITPKTETQTPKTQAQPNTESKTANTSEAVLKWSDTKKTDVSQDVKQSKTISQSQDKKSILPVKMIKFLTKNKAGFAILTFLVLLLAMLLNKNTKKAPSQDGLYNISNIEYSSDNQKHYQEILNDKNLNWQEKYKLISGKADVNKKEVADTYIAKISKKDVNNKNSAHSSQDKSIRIDYAADIDSRGLLSSNFGYRVSGIQKNISNREMYQKERLQDAISQMGSAINESSSFEDDAISIDERIMQHFSNIRQKSFKTLPALKMSDRHKLNKDKNSFANKIKSEIMQETNKSGLKKTKLATQRKNKGIHSIYSQKSSKIRNKAEQMDKDYSQTSLQEYLSILDNERNVYEIESTKGVTNPLNRSSLPKSLESINSLENLPVKSKYSIDRNKEIYMVNMDGVSAILGKVNDDIRVLKKFDKTVTSPLQVRHDENNVYMVKAGKYKSLVDVDDNRMDLLLEI